MGFGTLYDSFGITCLPNSTATYVIAPYWVDQRTDGSGPCAGCGIYTLTTGSAPNRTLYVEWRTVYYNQANTSPTLDYEVILQEGQTGFSVVYGNITAFAGTDSSLTIGVQKNSLAGDNTQYACQPNGATPPVSTGQQLNFTYSNGTCLTNTPTRTSTPTITPTATNTPFCVAAGYAIASATATGVPTGTTDIGNHCDDCSTLVTFPFPVSVYGTSYGSAYASSNGTLNMTDSVDAPYSNVCLPSASTGITGPFLAPYWDDQYTSNAGFGIFTAVTGSAPNRQFIIEWRNQYFPGSGGADYSLVFYENNLNRFDVFYGTLTNGNTSATVGAQFDGTTASSYVCNGSGGALNVGTQLIFTYSIGTCPTATPTNTASPTSTPICPWTQQAPYPINVLDNAAASQGGKVYSFAGVSNDLVIATSYVYNPSTNTWSLIAPLPSAREAASAVERRDVYLHPRRRRQWRSGRQRTLPLRPGRQHLYDPRQLRHRHLGAGGSLPERQGLQNRGLPERLR